MCCTVVTVTIKCGKCSERKLDKKQWEYERGIPEVIRLKEEIELELRHEEWFEIGVSWGRS